MKWILAALLLTVGAGAGSAYAQALPQPKPQTQPEFSGRDSAGRLRTILGRGAAAIDNDAISAMIRQDHGDAAGAAKSPQSGATQETAPFAPPKMRLLGQPITPLSAPAAAKSAGQGQNVSLPPKARIIDSPPVNAPTIGNYPLSEALLARLEKIHREILALPGGSGSDDDTDSDNIDILAKALEKRADIMEVLSRNLISSHDYIMAMQAVINALAAATGADDDRTSAANIAFGKQYAGRIRALLEE